MAFEPPFSAGPQGAQGPQGTTGATGAQGSAGATGAQGSAGSTGPQGSTGSTGATGAQGNTGAQGPQGVGGAAASIPSGYDTVSSISTTNASLEDMTGLSTSITLAQTAAITATMTVNTNVSVSLATIGGFAISINGVDSTVMTQAYFGLGSEETVVVTFEQTLAAGTYTVKGRFKRVSGVGTVNVDLAQIEAIGLQGAQGVQGSTGAAGAQGATGSTGTTGAQGATGSQGTQGSTGSTGPQGSTGAAGTQGSQGTTGSQGAQGATGAQGSTGTQGSQGAQGVQGATGSQGPQGTQGATGAQGSSGAQGSQGSQGSQGTQGTQGSQGSQGSTGSSSTNLASLSFFVGSTSGSASGTTLGSGFSDATPKLILAGIRTSTTILFAQSLEISADVGNAAFPLTFTNDSSAVASAQCELGIGSDIWVSNNNATAGNRIEKNSSAVTISGTTPSASPMLGHDPTLSYLLVMDATNRIRRYSGIAGTTITFVDSITLDTAVTMTVGFLFDNTNSRYICLDTTNNLIRRFNSAGTTIDTVSYTFSDTNVKGLAILGGRVYVVSIITYDSGSSNNGYSITLIPSTMTV